MLNGGRVTKAVVFDVGGVLVELGGVSMLQGWVEEHNEAMLWERWLSCPWVRRFERGRCSAEAFADGMVETWGLGLSPAAFLDAFATWPRGLFDGAAEMVREIRPGISVACFSNTNEIHWENQQDHEELTALFSTEFVSYRMDLVKPDIAAFEHVVDRLGVSPAEVLFLDDNQINVEGARAIGVDAQRVVGISECRSLLADRGLLEG